MIEGFVEAFLHGIFEVVCYGAGKMTARLFGFRCSLDDQWVVRQKKRGKIKPPWTWHELNADTFVPTSSN